MQETVGKPCNPLFSNGATRCFNSSFVPDLPIRTRLISGHLGIGRSLANQLVSKKMNSEKMNLVELFSQLWNWPMSCYCTEEKAILSLVLDSVTCITVLVDIISFLVDVKSWFSWISPFRQKPLFIQPSRRHVIILISSPSLTIWEIVHVFALM